MEVTGGKLISPLPNYLIYQLSLMMLSFTRLMVRLMVRLTVIAGCSSKRTDLTLVPQLLMKLTA